MSSFIHCFALVQAFLEILVFLENIYICVANRVFFGIVYCVLVG